MRVLRLTLSLVLTLAAFASAAQPASLKHGMVAIAGGSFRPLFAVFGHSIVRVAPFALDTVPVSEAEFLAFVQRSPAWGKGHVSARFADENYLRGVNGSKLKAIARVSWFAAEAYCRAGGARLPTTNEWEFAASASETARDAARETSFRQRALELAMQSHRSRHLIASGLRNVWGVRDLHGVIDEWTQDFKAATGAAHAHGSQPENARMNCATGAVQSGDAGDYAAFLRYGFRSATQPNTTSGQVGFRCAANL